MRTLAPGEYQILACCAAIARTGCPPPDGVPELAPGMTYETSGPNVFVFCGAMRDQGALLSLLKALIAREFVIQSVRLLDNDDLLDPLCSQDDQDSRVSQPGT